MPNQVHTFRIAITKPRPPGQSPLGFKFPAPKEQALQARPWPMKPGYVPRSVHGRRPRSIRKLATSVRRGSSQLYDRTPLRIYRLPQYIKLKNRQQPERAERVPAGLSLSLSPALTANSLCPIGTIRHGPRKGAS